MKVYGTPQVVERPLDGQGSMINPGIVPEMSLAPGLSAVAGEFSQAGMKANVLLAEDRLNTLREKQGEYTQWVHDLKGKAVVTPEAYGGTGGEGLHKTSLGWFDSAVGELGVGLTGHALAAFRQGAQRFRAEFSGLVQHHETQQFGVIAKDTYQGAQLVEDQTIAQSGIDPTGRINQGTLAQSLNRKVYAANQYSEFLGEGADMRQARELEAKSNGYALVLDGLLKRNNTQGAQVFFDAHRSELDKQVVSTMETKISQATLADDVLAHADRISALGLPLDLQDAEARKVFNRNPEGRAALQAELEHRFSVQRTAQTAATQDTTGKLWDMRFPTLPDQPAVPMSQVMRSPEWAKLTGTQRNALVAEWESHSKRNQNDPATQVAQYAAFNRFLDDPKALMAMSDAQIASFTGTLGADLTKKAMDAKRHAKGSLDSLKANTLGDLPWKDIAGEYGLKTKGSMSPADQASLGLLRDTALDLIRDEQAATGKPMLVERKEEVLRSLLAKSPTKRWVINPARWVGDTYTPDGKRLFELKDFMEIDATTDEKMQAVGYLVQNEAPLSTVNVQTMINAIRAKKVPK